MANSSAIGIFIPVFMVLMLIQLFTPCIQDAVVGIESGFSCVNSNPVQSLIYDLNEVFADIPVFNVVFMLFTGFFNIIFTLVQTLTWGLNINVVVNIILIPIRLIALICIYYIAFPTK